MNFATGLNISSSGLTAERMRMNAIAANIANINTTVTPQGGPYRRKEVVFEAMPQTKNFGEILTSNSAQSLDRVQVTRVINDPSAPIMKYEPDNPNANAQGYVAYPNINLMEEMTDMIQASRSYQANVSAMQATKSMAMTALEIGR